MIQFPETARDEWNQIEKTLKSREILEHKISVQQEIEKQVTRIRIREEAKQQYEREREAGMTPPLVMGTAAELLALQPTTDPDIIEGVLKAEGVAIVLGPSHSGKSMIAAQMVSHMLSGDDWMGQPVVPIKGSVGVLSYDMDYRTFLDWFNSNGTDMDRVSVVKANQGNPLALPDQRAAIINNWKAQNVEVVLIDSFSASFYGTDQNDAAGTVEYYRQMREFVYNEVGAKVLILIVHSTDSNPKKARGSTTHKDMADSMIVVTVDPDKDRVIEMDKYRQVGAQQPMPTVVTQYDGPTKTVSVNVGKMSLAGQTIPTNLASQAMFPDTEQDPDVSPEPDSDSEQEGVL